MENVLVHICSFVICTKEGKSYDFDEKAGRWITTVGICFPNEKIEEKYDYDIYVPNEGRYFYYAFVEFDKLELDHIWYVIDKPYDRVLFPMPTVIKESLLEYAREKKCLKVRKNDEMFNSILNTLIENGYVSRPSSDDADLNATN